jgi:hypothetical protein
MTDIDTTTAFNSILAANGFNPDFSAMPTGGMGRNLPMGITPCTNGKVALMLAGIDWEVETTSLADLTDLGRAADTTISHRSDNGDIIGINGKKHVVIQNAVLAELGDAIIGCAPGAKYVAGGARNMGEMTFLQIELPSPLRLGEGEEVSRFITLYTNHNGGKIVTMASNFRPSCTNQWGELLRQSQRLTAVAHTASSEMRLREAVFTLEAAVTQFDEWDLALRELIATPARLADHIGNIVGPRPDKEGRTLTIWENTWERVSAELKQDFNSNINGTAFGVLMAAQGADEHTSKCGVGKRPEQQIGRLVTARYPLARRALRSLVNV